MASRPHIRCLACGSLRLQAAFGIEEGTYDPEEAPNYEPGLSVQEIGGRGRCSWNHGGLPLAEARALRASLAAAIDRLDEAIRSAEEYP